ncbi:hypothetical protein RJ639_031391 [Escallonia herrerae]|uniref:FAR1 domain-containing protein n=1 Tax=Escallonia herrerae TaxID=1293975 RepID=A0AA89BDU4_9ASTE|nr:hypothetical protein RJ639_031391 [Escallonia herrerae]
MHIIDNGEMHDGQECVDLNQECVDLGVVPFEYNEGKTRDGERCEDFEECSEETIIEKVFGGQEEAYEFYNRYALVKGFGTCIHYSHKNKMTNEIFRRQFVCNKQGFKKLDDKRKLGKQLKRHGDTRTGCGGMMQITLSNKFGMWVVDKFEDIHNHPLSATPSKVVKHRSHSKYHRSVACKRLVYTLNQKGLQPAQFTRVVNAMKPGEEANITMKQCSSIINSERKKNVGQQCYGIIKHFQEKNDEDERECNLMATENYQKVPKFFKPVQIFKKGNLYKAVPIDLRNQVVNLHQHAELRDIIWYKS